MAGNVNSFAERFARTGCCEVCYTQGREYKVGQGGDEVDCVIADASAKDVPGVDWRKVRPLLEVSWTGRTKSYRERGWVADGEREAIGWEYSFFVPHALPELVRLCGGETEFVRRLDFAFGHKLINFGNEPSFQTPWLFAQAGRPDLTDRWARAVLDLFPADGCPGDDDSGAMGAYYVFLVAGFMPVAGSDVYVLHRPAVESIVFRLPQAQGLAGVCS